MFTPHKISHFVIRWLKSGTGKITVDHVDYELKQNTLFFGHPDQIRIFDVEKDSDFDTVFIAFTSDLFAMMNLHEGIESTLALASRTPAMQLNEENRVMVEDIFSLLLKIDEKDSPHKMKMIAGLLQVLLLSIVSINQENAVKLSARKQDYINLFRIFLGSLNENHKKFHFTSDYADLMFVPLKRLNRACKSVAGKTAGKIIADRLDFEAKRFLYYSTNTVKEISYELGFSDPTYFIRFFKNMNGISPKAFRNTVTKLT